MSFSYGIPFTLWQVKKHCLIIFTVMKQYQKWKLHKHNYAKSLASKIIPFL